MSRNAEFLRQSAVIAVDEVHRGKLDKAMRNYRVAVNRMVDQQFTDWEALRQQAAAVKDHVLGHWPEMLEQFEQKITERGAIVLWAEDAEEAREHIKRIMSRHEARLVVKSKSMVTEEIELNELLESSGIQVIESDLGELIVQLCGEKPYHIVTPAMHKSKEEISVLFQQKLGTPPTDDAAELTMAARAHLRQVYVTADVGITGANFLLADEGAIAVTENEGNARLTMGCPKVHVVVAGMEKMLPRMADLALFWPILASSGTGQQLTSYNSIVRGPRQANESDGPETMYVILLDNGRSHMYSDPRASEALRCIRCGACLNACPVFKTVGGHTYKTTYQGPIGSVITPHLRNMKDWQHLSHASTLCGACTSVCPVAIDLHGLLLENRRQATQEQADDAFWRFAMRGWSFGMRCRWRMEWGRRLYRWLGWLMPIPQAIRRSVPRLPAKSFAEQWRSKEKSSSGDTP